MKELHLICNAHLDPAWLWTWDEAMASIRATFRSALERMKEYPDFIFNYISKYRQKYCFCFSSCCGSTNNNIFKLN